MAGKIKGQSKVKEDNTPTHYQWVKQVAPSSPASPIARFAPSTPTVTEQLLVVYCAPGPNRGFTFDLLPTAVVPEIYKRKLVELPAMFLLPGSYKIVQKRKPINDRPGNVVDPVFDAVLPRYENKEPTHIQQLTGPSIQQGSNIKYKLTLVYHAPHGRGVEEAEIIYIFDGTQETSAYNEEFANCVEIPGIVCGLNTIQEWSNFAAKKGWV